MERKCQLACIEISAQGLETYTNQTESDPHHQDHPECGLGRGAQIQVGLVVDGGLVGKAGHGPINRQGGDGGGGRRGSSRDGQVGGGPGGGRPRLAGGGLGGLGDRSDPVGGGGDHPIGGRSRRGRLQAVAVRILEVTRGKQAYAAGP